MIAGLYRGVTTLLTPAIPAYLRRRLRVGKEDPLRLPERFGRPGLPRPAGQLVWLHAASVGEAMSVLPVIERLLRHDPRLHLLLTTGTVTSARLMAGRLPARAMHQFVPVDAPAYVRRFLAHWRPDLAIWVESEFWPNLIAETRRRGVPMALINARMSDSSYRQWRRLRGTIRAILSAFELCIAQSPVDAGRLADLGVASVICCGNLKDSAPPLPADPRELYRLSQAIGRRPRWLAASTHQGEEDAAGTVHLRLKAEFPDLLTVIVPRHPDRGGAIADDLAARGLAVACRSRDEAPLPGTDIYIADTLGELGLFYRAAGIVFVGGSLVPHGGQNPLEAARLESALLFGPHTFNFTEQVARLVSSGGGRTVGDAAALAEAIRELLLAPDRITQMAAAAAAAADAGTSVIEAVIADLLPLLDHGRG